METPLQHAPAGLSRAPGLFPPRPQFLYLPLYLTEHQVEPRFELRPPVIGEVTGEQPGLLKQYAHVPQLRKLRISHLWLPFVLAFASHVGIPAVSSASCRPIEPRFWLRYSQRLTRKKTRTTSASAASTASTARR